VVLGHPSVGPAISRNVAVAPDRHNYPSTVRETLTISTNQRVTMTSVKLSKTSL
jgi:hypothetical protein